jgi:hypothetical protein
MRTLHENERPKAEPVKERKVKKRERSKESDRRKNRTSFAGGNER